MAPSGQLFLLQDEEEGEEDEEDDDVDNDDDDGDDDDDDCQNDVDKPSFLLLDAALDLQRGEADPRRVDGHLDRHHHHCDLLGHLLGHQIVASD